MNPLVPITSTLLPTLVPARLFAPTPKAARHVLDEGREISREEAELLVGLSATVSTYVLRKPAQ
jgi:hypothetical protein